MAKTIWVTSWTPGRKTNKNNNASVHSALDCNSRMQMGTKNILEYGLKKQMKFVSHNFEQTAVESTRQNYEISAICRRPHSRAKSCKRET